MRWQRGPTGRVRGRELGRSILGEGKVGSNVLYGLGS